MMIQALIGLIGIGVATLVGFMVINTVSSTLQTNINTTSTNDSVITTLTEIMPILGVSMILVAIYGVFQIFGLSDEGFGFNRILSKFKSITRNKSPIILIAVGFIVFGIIIAFMTGIFSVTNNLITPPSTPITVITNPSTNVVTITPSVDTALPNYIANINNNTFEYDKELQKMGQNWESKYYVNDTKYTVNLEDI